MRRIKCFMIEPTPLTRYWYRRYSSDDDLCRGGAHSYHNAEVLIGDLNCHPFKPPVTSEVWPKTCDGCGASFEPHDAYQIFPSSLWSAPDRPDLGVFTLDGAPHGAMSYMPWVTTAESLGPDGKALAVITPGGSWYIDSRASNCTMPNDTKHRCWVRHGAPPNITVDKNGNTCAAGAGSIACGGYHGFLRAGYLED